MAYARPSGLESLESVEKVLLNIELPEGFGLYDFGGGWTVAPVSGLEGVGYLRDHSMVAVERLRKTETDPARVTGFKFDLHFVTTKKLREGLFRAAEYNKTQTTTFYILPTQETQ
jgi:hypothetical protein